MRPLRAGLKRAADLGTVLSVGVLVGACLPLIDRARQPAASAAPALPSDKAPLTWRAILWRSAQDFGRDRISAVAAGVTFFGLLAIFPAMSAFISLYGLIADVGSVRKLLASMSMVLPGGVISVIGDEIARLTATGHTTLGFAFAFSLVLSLWSANAGVKALIDGLNVAYDRRETRGFIKLTAVSLAFTLGGIALGVLSVAAIAAAPIHVSALGLPASVEPFVRWAALLVLAFAMISLLYRFGPDRPQAGLRWITPGAVIATLGWAAMSLLFSWYVGNFGSYNKTYGSLGAIVGFLTWVWLSLMVLMFGAELNSEAAERHAHSGAEPAAAGGAAKQPRAAARLAR
jgi:membrane protein